MATNIEDLRSFSIHDLKRLGMLRDSFNGLMNWTQNGETVSTICLYICLSGNAPTMVLHYNITHTGEAVQDLVKLHHQKSNLPGHTGGYWMFICPMTRKPCRVLYLHGGHFKSREALPPGTLYKCQTTSAYFRNIGRIFDYEDMKTALNDTLSKPYGKMFYRGRPTRKTNRLMKIDERYEQIMFQWLREQRDK
jgi:hypothetical protein